MRIFFCQTGYVDSNSLDKYDDDTEKRCFFGDSNNWKLTYYPSVPLPVSTPMPQHGALSTNDRTASLQGCQRLDSLVLFTPATSRRREKIKHTIPATYFISYSLAHILVTSQKAN